MALSRIWSAFIIIAIFAAGFSCIFFDGGTAIFSKMVIGKLGDTSKTQIFDSSNAPAPVLLSLGTSKDFNPLRFSRNQSPQGSS